MRGDVEYTIEESGAMWREHWADTGPDEKFVVPFMVKGGDWRKYYEDLVRGSPQHHLVFLNFVYSGGVTVFAAFRSRSKENLEAIIENELLGEHGLGAEEIRYKKAHKILRFRSTPPIYNDTWLDYPCLGSDKVDMIYHQVSMELTWLQAAVWEPETSLLGNDWKKIYAKASEMCGDEYHMVFIPYEVNGEGHFVCFRSERLSDLDALFKMDVEEVDIREPSGWLYASYKSEAEQLKEKMKGMKERLIEVERIMRGMME